jgi:hypothetical protein
MIEILPPLGKYKYDTWSYIDNSMRLWSCLRNVNSCVVRFIPLQGRLLIRISVTPSDMGDGLFAVDKRSDSTFIMLYLVHEMDIDYLVVDEMVNISNLFDYTCMIRI